MTLEQVLSKLKFLLDRVLSDLDAFAESLPAGIRPTIRDLERIISNAVADLIVADLPHTIAAQLIALVITMRGEVEHDDTELA